MAEPQAMSALRKQGKYAKHMYARRPTEGNDPGWIVVVTRSNLEDYMIRGFIPLWQYGYMEDYFKAHPLPPERSVPPEGKWWQILTQPGGPEEFPVDQVLTLRWYRSEDCPLPGVRFPQLAGHKVKEFKCPECRRAFYAQDGTGGIADLGIHLKYIHSWDRPSLVNYGETVGIDFNAIYSKIEKTYEFEPESEPEPEAPVSESGLETVGKFDCDQCDWKPKQKAKRPGRALMMHKQGSHPEPVPA